MRSPLEVSLLRLLMYSLGNCGLWPLAKGEGIDGDAKKRKERGREKARETETGRERKRNRENNWSCF